MKKIETAKDVLDWLVDWHASSYTKGNLPASRSWDCFNDFVEGRIRGKMLKTVIEKLAARLAQQEASVTND